MSQLSQRFPQRLKITILLVCSGLLLLGLGGTGYAAYKSFKPKNKLPLVEANPTQAEFSNTITPSPAVPENLQLTPNPLAPGEETLTILKGSVENSPPSRSVFSNSFAEPFPFCGDTSFTLALAFR